MLWKYACFFADQFMYFTLIDSGLELSYRKRVVQKIVTTAISALILTIIPNHLSNELLSCWVMILGAFLYVLSLDRDNFRCSSNLLLFIVAIMGMKVIIKALIGFVTYLFWGKLFLSETVPLLIYILAVNEVLFSIGYMVVEQYTLMTRKIRRISIVYLESFAGLIVIICEEMCEFLFRGRQGRIGLLFVIMCATLSVCVLILLINHYRFTRVLEELKQENNRLNIQLHRSKELIPLLISTINEHGDLLDAGIVNEFRHIFSEQMKLERNNMNEKLLGSTGLTLLDAQLQHYMRECTMKDIIMDAFVTENIQIKVQEQKIIQIQLHELIGDVMRNAIRAIEKNEGVSGKILFIIGVRKGFLEVDIYDNGIEIPMDVLQKFGQRGITTGGTGYGLADMIEILQTYQASLILRENDSVCTYRKGFHLIFDQHNRRELQTYREVTHSVRNRDFWTKITCRSKWSKNVD